MELPWRILDKLINDYIEGRLGGEPPIEQVAVLQIDNEGGKLAGPNTDRPDQVPNPRGSIVGRVMTNAADKDTPDSSLIVFWPINQHEVMPVKEGESVVVLYMDSAKTHGLWIARAPEPNDIHNLNFTSLTKRFRKDPDNDIQNPDTDTGEAHQVVQDLEENPGVPKISKDFTVEEDAVPEYNQRVGDRVIHGSNNASIILSRDRVDTRESGQKEESGTIDLVVGREKEDIDIDNDSARVYISAKTDGDSNFSLDSFGDTVGGVSYVSAKADQVRLVARDGIKIVVEDGPTSIVMQNGKVTIKAKDDVDIECKNANIKSDADIVLNAGGQVKVGSDAAMHPLVRGDDLKRYLKQVFEIYSNLVVDVAGIPGIGVANGAVASAVNQLDTVYDQTVISNNNLVEE